MDVFISPVRYRFENPKPEVLSVCNPVTFPVGLTAQTAVVLPGQEHRGWAALTYGVHLTEAFDWNRTEPEASRLAPVRSWTSRLGRASSPASAAQAVVVTTTTTATLARTRKPRRLVNSAARRPEPSTTSQEFYTSSSTSGPASRCRGRIGRWSGPSCR